MGGRYSVLSPVGLLPLAVAGVDVDAFVEGARDMERMTAMDTPIENNPAAQYAIVRDRIEWLYTCDLGNDLRNGN